ncbi:MAG TPA: HAMP domain-containing sensor histidine kinase [Gemmatimonadaceae bacterium]|nr:HAMP domain-containing sensor histidine kinase [Gemmatimonadaceae bacterium]
MTIRARLALGLFAIAVVLLGPLAYTVFSLRQFSVETRRLSEGVFSASMLVSRIRTDLDEIRRAEQALNANKIDSLADKLAARVRQAGTRADTLRRFNLDTAADTLGVLTARMAEHLPRYQHLLSTDSTEAADSLSAAVILGSVVRAEQAIRRSETVLRQRMGEGVRAAQQRAQTAQSISAGAFAIAGLLVLGISILTWRTIANPIRDLEDGMAAVAGGNFTYRLGVSPRRDDEFGRLAVSFRSMADQLLQLDRLKAEFVSIASHELKTPINVVLGYLQLLQEEVYGPLTHRQREVLGTLEAQSRSLARLVHQLLDMSRFEAGGGKLDIRSVHLPRFLEDLEQSFRVLAIQRGVAFEIERAGAIPNEVFWDPDRVNEVLGNLLSNAFKFTERGGTVTLRIEGGDGMVGLEVRDTGAGIPPDQLPHVFEKFYQASNQEAAAQIGTGLGLAIAKQIVVAHGGEVAVDSTVGVGTSFYITLPVRGGSRIDAAVGPLREEATA